MTKRRKPRNKPRRGINEGTSSIGIGPVSFDIDMARRHGWMDVEIESFWQQINKAYAPYSRRMNRRYPDRYARSTLDGTVIYIGPDDDGHALDISKLDHMEPLSKQRGTQR